MAFAKNIDDIEVFLQIRYYTPSTDIYDYNWCSCDFSFRFEDIINYHKEDDEVLESSEIDGLCDTFTDLLDGKIDTLKEIGFIEPDFEFTLYPGKNLPYESGHSFAPREGTKDIAAEWRIYFWYNGLTENHLSILLDRDDIKELRDYLSRCQTPSEN